MKFKLPLFEKNKFARIAYGLLIVLFTAVVFTLDVLTRNAITFDVFYFPSVILMAWLYGSRAGYSMSVVVAAMWLIAQQSVGEWGGMYLFLSDGLVHLLTFVLICAMTGLVRRKNEQLEAKSKELVGLNTQLEQFAFRAAHDLQAPLTVILGYTELLNDKCKKTGNAEWNECTDNIMKGVERMKTLTRSLLDYARASKPESEVPFVDLEKTVREAIENFHFVLSEKKGEVTFDPLPKLRINPGLAGVLFQNLIGNAIKYCEKEPRLHVSAERRGKEWLFKIRDNGIGIPKEDQAKIFVMFERVANRNQYPGSGIGLATCEKIVNRYGGQICVDSAPGEGSTFYFTLPAVEAVFTK